MNVQRGVRRIVLAISLGVFVVSLGFGGYTMKRISDRRALIARNERVATLRRAEDVRIQKEFAGRTNTLEASLARNPFLETTPVSIAPSWWDWNLGVIGIIMVVFSGALADRITGGKLVGRTDTDYFHFDCPDWRLRRVHP